MTFYDFFIAEAVKRRSTEEYQNALKKIQFCFLIPLRNINKESSLAELMKAQLGLDNVPTGLIKDILAGKYKDRTLIILDGYDEYTRGTYADIDRLIESPANKSFLIITSRVGEYLKKDVRDQMDGELIIEGFSKENIKKCSSLYLESEETSREFLKQAKRSKIKSLLHVPIVLLMSCMVFAARGSLPKTQTELFGTAREVIMNRTTLKTFGKKSTELKDLASWLDILGEMSWKALQGDDKQLLLDKVSEIDEFQWRSIKYSQDVRSINDAIRSCNDVASGRFSCCRNDNYFTKISGTFDLIRKKTRNRCPLE